jgi:hypothetical protein
MFRPRNDVGRKPGYRQVTLYVEPMLYERVKNIAYTLDEDVYVFVSEALKSACERRVTQSQRDAIDSLIQQNIKNRARLQKQR